jgi:putative transposase
MAQKRQRVTRFLVQPDDRVSLHGRPYRFEREFEDGIVFRSDDDKPKEVVALNWQDIDGHYRKFHLKIEKGYYSVSNAIERASVRKKRKHFDMSPEDILRALMVRKFLEEQAEGKENCENPSAALKRSDAKIKRFYRKFEIENAEIILEARIYKKSKGSKRDVFLSTRQFCRLIDKFQKSEQDDGAVVRQHRGRVPTGGNFTEDQREHFDSFLKEYLSENEPSVRAVYTKMEQAQLVRAAEGQPVIELCSYSTFLRMVREMDDVVVDLARSRDKHRVTRKDIISGKGLRVLYPMQILEMDEHKVDLIRILKNMKRWKLLHPEVQEKIKEMGRPWLSVAMDAFSRSICGMRLLVGEPDGAESVATLAMAVRNKEVDTALSGLAVEWPQCGTPDAVHTDAGPGYISSDFQRAVIGLTGQHRIPPSRHPHLRARVERFFRTINSRYMHEFSGRTFANVLEKDNYDPRKHAHLSHEQLGELLIRLIVNAYHNTPHRSLNGQTPLDAWYRGSNQERPVSPPPADDEYRDIFGLSLERKIGNQGLTILGIPYWSEELAETRDRTMAATLMVRVNDHNLGTVSFEDPEDGEWKDAYATFEGLDNVSIADWIETVSYITSNYGPRARNSKRAKEIVLQTLTRVQKDSESSRLLEGVASPLLTARTIERFEKTKMATFQYSRHLWYDRGTEVDRPPETVVNTIGSTGAIPAVDVMNPQGEFDNSGLVEPKTGKPINSPKKSSPRRVSNKVARQLADDGSEVDDSHIVLRVEEMDGSDD